MNRVLILGVPVDAISEAGAVEWVADAIRAGQPRQVATVNPEFIMRARHDGRFLNVLSAADLCIPDGYGVVWAARRLGHRLPSRVAGVDLIRSLAARGAREGWRFFFLGAGPGVAESAAAALEKANPGLVVAGCLAGSPDPAQDTVTAAAVRSARTDLLLVAYGAPGQDLWIARNLHQSGARVAIGVGGAFDFISGGARRAPRWMRERGLEWLHRLVQEPWRWRRMLALPRFALAVLRQAR